MAKRIYFAGIGGAGLFSLAQLAKAAGYEVLGSDIEPNANVKSLRAMKIPVSDKQDGSQIEKEHTNHPIDWFVATAALPPGNAELIFAKQNNIKISKRDELLNTIIEEKKLRLIAVSGTHGKTTVTGMIIWLFKELGIPVSYAIGTNLSFGASAVYTEGSEYFIYEADEFDRNFLKFKPYLSVIPTIEYDHNDTYPNVDSYKQAFTQFINESHCSFLYDIAAEYLALVSQGCVHILDSHNKAIEQIKLTGFHNRQNGFLALAATKSLVPESKHALLISALNKFPGTVRRMEKLAPNLYSDYAHLPTEIKATLQLASELSDNVVAVYQPHQNIRQHEIKGQYKNSFAQAKKIYWLPTYQSREDKSLETLEPTDLIANLDNKEVAEPAKLGEALAKKIKQHQQAGDLVVLMGAGSIDPWARKNLI